MREDPIYITLDIFSKTPMCTMTLSASGMALFRAVAALSVLTWAPLGTISTPFDSCIFSVALG